MHLAARPIRSEESIAIDDCQIDTNLLRRMRPYDPEQFIREIESKKDSNTYFSSVVQGLKFIPNSAKSFAIWESELKSTFVELYLPPLTAHHLFVHRAPGGIVRRFLHDTETVHAVRVDEICVIPAHTPVYLSGCGSFNTLHLTISPEFIQKTVHDSNLAIDPRMQLGACLEKRDVVAAYLISAMAEYARTSRWQALNSLGIGLVVHLLEGFGVMNDRESLRCLDKQQIQRVRDFMISGLGEIPDIEEIARQLRFSTVAFCRQFKTTTGLTPLAFYRNLRMQCARELVETSQKSLTEIAMDLGFTDAAHFSNAFHKHWKLPPSSFRS